MKPKILFAADHAGYELKEKLIPFVQSLGYEVQDMGAHALDVEDDYPDYVSLAARRVSEEPNQVKAIIIGGSGQGEAICANRFKRVRAVVFNGQYKPTDAKENDREVPDEIKLSRVHNDANVLSLGARFLNDAEAKAAVQEWLSTDFSNEPRHIRRIEKLDAMHYI